MREMRTRPGSSAAALRDARPVLSLSHHQNSVFTQIQGDGHSLSSSPPAPALMVTKYYSPAIRPAVATTAQLGKLLSKLLANLTKLPDLNVTANCARNRSFELSELHLKRTIGSL